MRKYSILLIVACAALPVAAKVTLPSYVTDNMIVQQNSTFTINGHAAPSSDVKVTAGWNDAPQRVKADKNGKFTVKLPTPGAGGPYAVTFED